MTTRTKTRARRSVLRAEDGQDDLRAHALRRRRIGALYPATIVRQAVKCELSKTGYHYTTIAFNTYGDLIRLSCECDEQHRVGRSAWRLGVEHTCSRAIDLVRQCALLEVPVEDDPVKEQAHETMVADYEAVWPPSIRAMIDENEYRVREARAANRKFKPVPWERPAVGILSHRIGELVGTHDFKVTVDGKHLDRVFVLRGVQEPIEVAQYRGRAWLIKDLGRAVKYIGRADQVRGYYCRVCDQRFSSNTYADQHFLSEKHSDKVQKKFVNALGSLMPDSDD